MRVISEENIKPTDIRSFYRIMEDLKKKGLERSDIIKLIQRRTHPQMGLRAIERILHAVKQLERDIVFNQKRFNKS